MNLIVAVDKHWGIGYNNSLLVSIPADKKNFRAMTTGKTIIMGRRTLESFRDGKPLPDRNNIVITTKKNYDGRGAIVVHSVEEALEKARELSAEDDIFVIGGGQIYKQLYEQCKKAYVTKIDYSYRADTFFPDLDADKNWKMTEESEEQTCFDIEFTFCTYDNLLLEKE
ncbi:MAG: dihydrofolate reductase [Lachnospiraceae bacterium]|nr:dihydrofolate reductase [Lachnospiraceae bacterium]